MQINRCKSVRHLTSFISDVEKFFNFKLLVEKWFLMTPLLTLGIIGVASPSVRSLRGKSILRGKSVLRRANGHGMTKLDREPHSLPFQP